MRVLFFVDPTIEWGQPDRKFWWIYNSAQMMAALEPDPAVWPDRFRILTGERFARRAAAPDMGPGSAHSMMQMPTACLRSLSRADLRAMLDLDAPRFLAAWSRGDVTAEQRAAAAELIRRRVGSFEPDLVITFSISPFLRDAYPAATVLEHDSGMLTMPPFSPGYYLDPCGKLGRSFTRRFAADIRAAPLDDAGQARLGRLRAAFIDATLRRRSPFAGLKESRRDRFDSVWLVATHLDANPVLGDLSHQPFLDYLSWVLDSVGERVGIVVSQHPSFQQPLTPEVLTWLADSHPNFIVVDKEWEVNCSSHFLFDAVDGVIGLDSSVTQHALLWGKKIVTLIDNHMTGFADATDLHDLSDVARRPLPPDRDAVLHWLLTRYYVPQSYMYDAAFLGPRLESHLRRARAGIGADFYDLIDDPDRLIDGLIAAADPNVPRSQLDNRLCLPPVRLTALHHAECTALNDRIARLEQTLADSRAAESERFLQQIGSPARLSAENPDGAFVTDPELRLTLAAAAADAGRPDDAVRDLIWALLRRRDDPAPAAARDLLRRFPKLWPPLFRALGALSDRRWRRLYAYAAMPAGLEDACLIRAAEFRRRGVALWPDLGRVAGPVAGGEVDRGLLQEIVARFYCSDVAPLEIEAGPPDDAVGVWRQSGVLDRLEAIAFFDDPPADMPETAPLLAVCSGAIDLTPPASAFFDNTPPRLLATGGEAEPLTPRAGDVILLNGLTPHCWTAVGAKRKFIRLIFHPDTLRNRALAPPRRRAGGV
jgi:hypothetical protein